MSDSLIKSLSTLNLVKKNLYIRKRALNFSMQIPHAYILKWTYKDYAMHGRSEINPLRNLFDKFLFCVNTRTHALLFNAVISFSLMHVRQNLCNTFYTDTRTHSLPITGMYFKSHLTTKLGRHCKLNR